MLHVVPLNISDLAANGVVITNEDDPLTAPPLTVIVLVELHVPVASAMTYSSLA